MSSILYFSNLCLIKFLMIVLITFFLQQAQSNAFRYCLLNKAYMRCYSAIWFKKRILAGSIIKLSAFWNSQRFTYVLNPKYTSVIYFTSVWTRRSYNSPHMHFETSLHHYFIFLKVVSAESGCCFKKKSDQTTVDGWTTAK